MNSDFKTSLAKPKKISSVSLLMEATKFFKNRYLSVSYTEKDGWEVEEVKTPYVNLTKTPVLEMDKAVTLENFKFNSSQSVENEEDNKKLKLMELLIYGFKCFYLGQNCFQKITKGTRPTLKCTNCSRSGGKKIAIAEHFYTTHFPAKKFICLYCFDKYSSRGKLKAHLDLHCKQIPNSHKARLNEVNRKSFTEENSEKDLVAFKEYYENY